MSAAAQAKDEVLNQIKSLEKSLGDLMRLSKYRTMSFKEAEALYGISEHQLRDATNRKFNRLPSIGRGAHKRLIPHLLEKWIDVQATRN